MLRTYLAGQNWGVEPIEAQGPDSPGGIQINLLDPESKHLHHVPFTGDSLLELLETAIEHVPQEGQKKLRDKLTDLISGIVTAKPGDITNGGPK